MILVTLLNSSSILASLSDLWSFRDAAAAKETRSEPGTRQSIKKLKKYRYISKLFRQIGHLKHEVSLTRAVLKASMCLKSHTLTCFVLFNMPRLFESEYWTAKRPKSISSRCDFILLVLFVFLFARLLSTPLRSLRVTPRSRRFTRIDDFWATSTWDGNHTWNPALFVFRQCRLSAKNLKSPSFLPSLSSVHMFEEVKWSHKYNFVLHKQFDFWPPGWKKLISDQTCDTGCYKPLFFLFIFFNLCKVGCFVCSGPLTCAFSVLPPGGWTWRCVSLPHLRGFHGC